MNTRTLILVACTALASTMFMAIAGDAAAQCFGQGRGCPGGAAGTPAAAAQQNAAPKPMAQPVQQCFGQGRGCPPPVQQPVKRCFGQGRGC
jgi:hypothetical protein